MSVDIRNQNFNASTYDKVATIGTITATDRAGVPNPIDAYLVGAIPKGAIITATYMRVEEAFDGTTPLVSVGVDGATTKFFSAVDLSTVALTPGTTGLDGINLVSEDLLMTTSASDSTVGKASVIIEYIDTDNRREMFTV